MRVPMQWLKQYTDIPVSAQAFQDAMINHGTGVEGLEDQNAELQNVVVGKVLAVRDHENSDHLHVCTVDIGEEQPVQIVCGAPNVSEGILVPVAKVGAKLPGGIEIKKGKLGRPILDTTITGVAFDMLKTVDMISDNVEWTSSGTCGKKQPMGVAMGGPELRCRVMIGGR